METKFVCGLCGAVRDASDVVIVREEDFLSVCDKESDYALPAVSRPAHDCGFIAIRCKEHRNAERNAVRAVKRHLAQIRSRARFM